MRAKLAKSSQVTQEVHDGRRVPVKATPPPKWRTDRRQARSDRDLTQKQQAKVRRRPPVRLRKQVIR
jgi:hypothetical protein